MTATRTMTFELPEDAAAEIEARVASGVYEDAAEFLRETVEASLGGHRPEVERWLSDEVAPTYDAYKADPSRLVAEEDAAERIAAIIRGRTDAT